MITMFFRLRKKIYFKNCSLKGALGNQKRLFYCIIAKKPFWNYYFNSVRKWREIISIYKYFWKNVSGERQSPYWLTSSCVKSGIHYTTFAPIYSFDKSTIVAQSQSQSADLSWQIP